ncbi:MAG: hypothetical protein C4582_12105 [Desulfobacteraceae bacterium]|jgi:coenzyme F420 hydrogenase subunit beta|nr:MAG: hypothetical protein C4582_12105 [Desulfobacteraceae bacterium]
MAIGEERYQSELITRVIEKGICVNCGACVGLCPYFAYFDGRVAVMDRCGAGTGRCLQVCPRAAYTQIMREEAKGLEGRDLSLGFYSQVLTARAKDKYLHEEAQYGGVVTALVCLGLEKGLFKGAVLTDRGGELSPGGALAVTPFAVKSCAGSRYSASGSLSILNKAIKDENDGIAVVGLPCQMEALERMQRSVPDGGDRASKVAIRIGLFCTWALDYRKLRDFLYKNGVKGIVRKYDIPPPPAEKFVVLTEEGQKEFPLGEIRVFVQKGCYLCRDMTAEWADISVGTMEGTAGWNTVLVRTERGKDFLDDAFKEGILEKGNLPDENLKHLIVASRNKRERGKKAESDMLRDSE